MFPSKYLKASDLPDEGINYTIENSSEVTFQDNSTKNAVKFKGESKLLVLNATNADVLFEHCAPDSEEWGGHKVYAFPTTTRMAGKVVSCIRLDKAKSKAQMEALKADAEENVSYESEE